MAASSIFKRHDLFSSEVPPATSWVSERTVPFLRAGEPEIPAARGGEQQPARQPLPSPAPCPAIRELSIQEEKIIQSLDRLNQRLQSKFHNQSGPTSSDEVTLYFVVMD